MQSPLDRQKSILYEWASTHIKTDCTAKAAVPALFLHYAHFVIEHSYGIPLKQKTFVTSFKAYLNNLCSLEDVLFKYENGSYVYGVGMPDDGLGRHLKGLPLVELKQQIRLKFPS